MPVTQPRARFQAAGAHKLRRPFFCNVGQIGGQATFFSPYRKYIWSRELRGRLCVWTGDGTEAIPPRNWGLSVVLPHFKKFEKFGGWQDNGESNTLVRFTCPWFVPPSATSLANTAPSQLTDRADPFGGPFSGMAQISQRKAWKCFQKTSCANLRW